MIETRYRDIDSSRSRRNERVDIEPFPLEYHSFISKIVHRKPFVNFIGSNKISEDFPDYANRNPSWHRQFSSAIIHEIVSPSRIRSDRIYGFICVDNRRGSLNNDVAHAFMIIASTAVFYVISSGEALEVISKSTGANYKCAGWRRGQILRSTYCTSGG